ncbi:MAG TPA: AraC family transcriptional regulator [Capsulimonadaceae bacterium]|jgi:AraC-like DNA-binding protein
MPIAQVINETRKCLGGPGDEVRHAFRHNGTPVIVVCRFLGTMRSSFPSPASFEHPSPVITRLFVPVEGHATIRAVGREYRLTTDAIYLLPAGMPFSATYECPTLYAFHMHVAGESGGTLFDPRLGIRELRDDRLRAMLVEAISSGTDGIAESIGFAVLQRFVAPEMDELAAKYARTERFRNVITEVEQRATAELTVEALASMANLSPSAASKAFRRATGVTLKAFLIGGLMRRAKEMLTYTDLPVRAIADDLRFAEVSYLSRMFKRETGMTPLEYRRVSREAR